MARMKLVAVAVAGTIASGCFISPVMHFGGGKTAEQAQHDGLDKQFPAQLTATEVWTGKVRIARLHVWADDEYRAQNLRWQRGFDEELEYANAVLTPMLGVQLQAEYHDWVRHAPGVPLEEHLAALIRQDSGDGAVWVVGLTSSLPLVTGTFDQIGVANVGDRHVVVRGHADVEERKAFEAAFPKIDREQRDSVLEARRRHKTTALLIHELAHSLGALHENADEGVMSAMYSHRAASVSSHNRELMLITLADRLAPAGERDPVGTAHKLLAVLDSGWDGWVAAEREEMVTGLREQLGGDAPAAPARAAAAVDRPAAGAASRAGAPGAPGKPGAARITASAPARHSTRGAAYIPVAPLPLELREKVREIENMVLNQDAGGAAGELAPLLAAYPAQVQLRILECRIEIARNGIKDAHANAACERAASMSAEAWPALEVADLRRRDGDLDGAQATVAAAEIRLADLPPERAAIEWLRLAEHYQRIEAVIRAGAAAASAGELGRDVATWAASTQFRYGIPQNSAPYKLAPADDVAALAAVRDVLAKVNAGKLDAAARSARAAEQRWPGLPGLAAARCDLEIRRGAIATARSLCSRAIDGGSSWALYLAGAIDLRSGGKAGAASSIAQLRKAIELDPDLTQAWHTLGKALVRSGATDELETLRSDYLIRFNTALPD